MYRLREEVIHLDRNTALYGMRAVKAYIAPENLGALLQTKIRDEDFTAHAEATEDFKRREQVKREVVLQQLVVSYNEPLSTSNIEAEHNYEAHTKPVQVATL